MFKKLTNFHYQRNTKEAVGFYFAYLLLILITGVVISGGFNIIFKPINFALGVRIGAMTAFVMSLSLSFLILKDKKLLKNFNCILLALVSGLLALFIGGLGGLIIPAYLTTKPANH